MGNQKVMLDPMLKSILSVASEDQNFFYSPKIYTDQYNAVTSLLLSELCKYYPSREDIQEMIEPFMRFVKIPVKDGMIKLPDDFRNILGNPYISLRPDGSECGSTIVIDTESEFKTQNLKRGCQTRPVIITPQSEFDYKTTSTYNYPTLLNPICRFMGEKKLQVCPYDISTVYVLYCKQETPVLYNYYTQPDDTFLFNPNGSIESEWTNASFTPLFNGLMSLYSAYAKDRELQEWSMILSQKSIL